MMSTILGKLRMRLDKYQMTIGIFFSVIFTSIHFVGYIIDNQSWNEVLQIGRHTLLLLVQYLLGVSICYVLLKLFFLFSSSNSPDSLLYDRHKNSLKVIWKKKLELKHIWMILTIFWLPLCLLHYPGKFGGGASNQVLQFLGEETFARELSSIVYEGHYITGHHPVLLTLYYGAFVKLGSLLGIPNILMFLMSITNLCISSFCMAFTMNRIKKYISDKAFRVLLVFLSIYPLYGIYAYTSCKDNLYASVSLIFFSIVTDAVSSKGASLKNKKEKAWFVCSTTVLPFLKNQGLYVVILSLILLLIYLRRQYKLIFAAIVSVIIFYCIVLNHIIMPFCKIAPGGRQEILCVPFQQTALYFKDHMEDVDDDEFVDVSKVIYAEGIGDLYKMELADPVKFTFNQDSTIDDLYDYFKVWIKQFIRHPLTYFRAWLGLNYGYYYLGYDKAQFNFTELNELGGVTFSDRELLLTKTEELYYDDILSLPIIGVLFRNASFTWILLLTVCMCIMRKKFDKLVGLFPIILNFAVLLLCPANGFTRYCLPLIYAIPVEMAVLFEE